MNKLEQLDWDKEKTILVIAETKELRQSVEAFKLSRPENICCIKGPWDLSRGPDAGTWSWYLFDRALEAVYGASSVALFIVDRDWKAPAENNGHAIIIHAALLALELKLPVRMYNAQGQSIAAPSIDDFSQTDRDIFKRVKIETHEQTREIASEGLCAWPDVCEPVFWTHDHKGLDPIQLDLPPDLMWRTIRMQYWTDSYQASLSEMSPEENALFERELVSLIEDVGAALKTKVQRRW
nr:hypothetical protein [uncultured Cohaesibacter sp.]